MDVKQLFDDASPDNLTLEDRGHCWRIGRTDDSGAYLLVDDDEVVVVYPYRTAQISTPDDTIVFGLILALDAS